MIQTPSKPEPAEELEEPSQSSIRPGDDSDEVPTNVRGEQLEDESQSSIRPGDDSDRS